MIVIEQIECCFLGEKQQIDELDIAIHKGIMERGVALFISDIDGHVHSDQHLHELLVSVLHS